MKAFRILAILGSFIILCLMPLACSTALSDGVVAPKFATMWVGIALLLSGVGLQQLAQGTWEWPRSPIVKATLAFLLWRIICDLASGLQTYTIPNTISYALCMAMFIVWSATLKRSDLWRCAGWISLVAALTGLYSHLQRLTLANIQIGSVHIGDFMGWRPLHLACERTIATMGNPDYFASYLGAALPLTLTWILRREKPYQRYLGLFFWGVSAIAMILTQTRSAWLGVLAAIPVWLVMTIRATSKDKRRSLYLTVGIMSVAVLLGTFSIYNWQKSLNPQLDLVNRVKNFADQKDLSIQARYYFWFSALRSATIHPLLGTGSGGHAVRAMQDRDLEPLPLRFPPRQMENVHSQILQVLAESGWLGMLLLLSTFVLFIKALYRQRDTLAAGVLSSATALWVSQIFICSTYPTDTLWMFLLAAATVLASPTPDTDMSDVSDMSEENAEPVDWHRMFIPVLVAIFGICFASIAAFMAIRCEYDTCQGGYLREDGDVYLAHPQYRGKAQECYQKAEQHYTNALEIAPVWRQAEIYRELGQMLKNMYTDMNQEQDQTLYARARECFESSLSFNDSAPFTYSCLADLQRHSPSEVDQALESLDKALSLDPRNPEYMNQKALTLLMVHRYAEGRDTAILGLSYCPISPRLWHTLATAYRYTGEYDLAERALGDLLRLDPNASGEVERIRKIEKAKQ